MTTETCTLCGAKLALGDATFAPRHLGVRPVGPAYARQSCAAAARGRTPEQARADAMESILDDVDAWLREAITEYAHARRVIAREDNEAGKLLARVRKVLGLPAWTVETEEEPEEAPPDQCIMRVSPGLF